MYVQERHVASPEECDFYHVMDLPGVGQVGGQWDLRGRIEDYIGNVPVKGRRVLDVGAASGFLTFELERLGAEVTSFDADSAKRLNVLPLAGHISFTDRAQWVNDYEANVTRMHNSYWFSHEKMKSKAKAVHGNIYDLPLELGMFDVVVVGQILVHLASPIVALTEVLKHCGDTIVITEGMMETKDPMMGLCARAEQKNIWSWWHLSTGLYEEVLTMAGFTMDDVQWKDFIAVGPSGPQDVRLGTIVAHRG